MNWNDTIVAHASASGPAALSIIRISGNQVMEVLREMAPKARLETRGSHQAFLCGIYFEQAHIKYITPI